MRRAVFFIFCSSVITSSFAQLVSNQDELDQAIANSSAGTEIILKNQVWANVIIDIDGAGSFSEPIIIRGETPGLTFLEGNCDINLGGTYVIFRDVIIRNAYGLASSGSRIDHLIEFEASNRNDCNNCTVTNIKIESYNGTESQLTNNFKWIYVLGKNNEISYSSFIGKYGVGGIITDNRSSGDVNFTKIHHNYFADRRPVGPFNDENDQDAIRIGSSSTSFSDSFTEVYNNYFYNFFGEIEIISNKSGQNQYYNNTFRKYSGTLTLRHGNNCKVYNNYFFAEKNFYSGGVRVIGEGHEIYNNYIQGVYSKKESGSNSSATGGINITNGRPDSELSGYFQVIDAKIINNTFVDCDYALRVGTKVKSDLTLAPTNIIMANNIMLDSDISAISETTVPINSTYSSNITQNGPWDIATGSNGNVISESGLLSETDEFYRISEGSLAIDAGSGAFEFMTTDILGGNRSTTYDAGAEEFNSGGTGLPYTSEDVGVNIGFGALTGELPDDLTASATSLRFSFDAGEQAVLILANVGWEVISNVDWLTTSPVNGSGSKQLTISATENETLSTRNGKLVISQVDGELQVEIEVTQEFDPFKLIDGELILVASVTAEGTQEPNIPENTLDQDETTRWSGESTDGSTYITYNLGKNYDIEAVRIMFHKGEERTSSFKLVANIANDEISSELITSSGLTSDFETFILNPELQTVEYLTIAGYGNSDSNWNSYNEVEIYGKLSAITIIAEIQEQRLEVYPNPAMTGWLRVESQGRIPLGKFNIISISGEIVYEVITDGMSISIDVSNLATGLYFLRTERGETTKVFIKR